MEPQQENKSGVGSIIGTIIIIAIIILGGLYFWGKRIEEQKAKQEIVNPDSMQTESMQENGDDIEAISSTSPSDDLNSIEADLNATDLDNLDSEVNAELQ